MVRGVFDSVANKYDIMNDAMSGGLHRIWKRFAVSATQFASGERVLDLASGTGDLIRLMAPLVGRTGLVLHTDINAAMLAEVATNLLNHGVVTPSTRYNAEFLPFADASFDTVTIAFGLRNVTCPGPCAGEIASLCSNPAAGRWCSILAPLPPELRGPYDWYSFNVLPKLGAMIAGRRRVTSIWPRASACTRRRMS